MTRCPECAKLRVKLKRANRAAWRAIALMSKSAQKAGRLQGEMIAIGWNGGVKKTVAAFRDENERLRARVADLEKRRRR